MILYFLIFSSLCDPSYNLVGSTLTISGNGSVTPEGVNAKAVSLIAEVIVNEGITTIKYNSFKTCVNMRRVSLPDSLVRMEACFSNTKLEEIVIPINVKEITVPYIWTHTPLGNITVNSSNQYFSSYGNCLLNHDQTHLYAFVNTPDFEFPSSLKSISSWAFAYKDNLIFKIPDKVTTMAYQSFVDTTHCTVIFSENSLLEEIPGRFFHQSVNCSFVIPPKVKKIDTEAFWGSRIKSISFHPGSQLNVISDKAINNCGYLKSIDLPKTVSSISQSAFEGCTNLESITVENGCEYLKDNGVYIYAPSEKKIIWVHHNISTFKIDADVEVICSSVLQTCVNLSKIELDPLNTNFSLHDNVVYTKYHKKTYSVIGGIETCEIHSNCTTITASFFRMMKKLKKITFAANSSCTKFEKGAFAYSSLEEIEFAESITELGEDSLRGIPITFLKFPPKLNLMGAYVCHSNERLTEVIFDERSPLQSISYRAFQDCSQLSKITFSKNVRQISYRSFYQCNLTSVEIPSAVSSIDEEALANNYYLSKITFCNDSDCVTISMGAFRSSAIECIALPKRLDTLSTSSFANCTKLKNVTFGTESIIKSLMSQTFMGCTSIESFLIPESVTSVDPTTFYRCSQLSRFEVDSKNMIYETFDGAVYERSPKALALFPPGRENAVIADGTIRISDNAFYGCSSLCSLDFGSSAIEAIGELTFFECVSLNSILIPKTVKTIFSRAFEGCVSMTSIVFANESQLLSIGSSTFSGCGNLTTVKFPSASLLEKIEDSTFEGCSLLSDFTFPPRVSSVGISAFRNCLSLRSAILNGTRVVEIADEAFRGCRMLSKLSLPNQLNKIGNLAFEDTAIQDLFIPVSVEYLGIGCFSQCKSLKRVFYCGDKKFESRIAFADSPNAIAFTLFSYPHFTFCGIPTLKTMERCGVFPTAKFTNNITNVKIQLGLNVVTELLGPHEDNSSGMKERYHC